MMRASSGSARSSSAVIALTVPSVPNGMNTGVGMSPRGVCRMPARAWPSVASSSNEKPGVGRANCKRALYSVPVQQGGVAVAVEPVAGGDRVAIGGEHALGAGERADQHEQGRLGEVEVGDQVRRDAERVAGARIDEELGGAGPGGDGAR